LFQGKTTLTGLPKTLESYCIPLIWEINRNEHLVEALSKALEVHKEETIVSIGVEPFLYLKLSNEVINFLLVIFEFDIIFLTTPVAKPLLGAPRVSNE